MENKEVLDNLASESLDSIHEAAGYLSDCSSSYSTINREEADAFIERILETFEYVDSLAPSEKRRDVRDEILNALVQITARHTFPDKSWDKLTESMEGLTPQELEYTLSILGHTHNPTYIPIIEKYLNHSVDWIREGAEDALKMIRNENQEHIPIKPIEVSIVKELAWLAFICGLLTNVVLYFAPHIGHAMHNDSMPLVFMFFLFLGVWGGGIAALGNHQRLLPILGILLSIPATSVFIWIVAVHIIPFYVRWFSGEV